MWIILIFSFRWHSKPDRYFKVEYVVHLQRAYQCGSSSTVFSLYFSDLVVNHFYSSVYHVYNTLKIRLYSQLPCKNNYIDVDFMYKDNMKQLNT